MELTSPILDFNQGGDWRSHIYQAFHSVEAVARIDTNITCGTHVHIAPARKVHWTESELHEIAFAIVFFEGAFLQLVPEHRLTNWTCRSNELALVKGLNRSNEDDRDS